MNEKIKELKEKIEDFEAMKELKKDKDNLYATIMQSVVDAIKSKEYEIENLKDEINIDCLDEYKITKDKNMPGGLKIKSFKTLTYDIEKALEWAKEKGLFLLLDEKGFKKSAETLNLDFVEEGSEYKVTYPKVIKLEE